MAIQIQRQRRAPDPALILVVGGLLLIGIVMVFSASVVRAAVDPGDPYNYLKRQAVFALLGIGAMYLFSRIDYWHWSRWARPALILCLLLLVAVLVPGIGVERNGARRWIGFGPLQFQPSEFMKFGIVIYLAHYLSQVRSLRHWRALILPFALLGATFVLIMAEPDMGTSLSIAGTVFVMLFAGGMELLHMGILGTLGTVAVTFYAFSAEYRRKRLFTFVNPEHDPLGASYQILQGLYALASGHLFGVGLGRSRQKFWYLPEPHTDYIFAIIGEELGFLGAGLVLALFLLFAWRGYRIAAGCPDRFSFLLATGVTTMITLQALMNIAVVTSSMPATGIPLPLISYGGSSLVVTLAGVGILLGISRYASR